jgi:Zn-dependent metalloprotease
MFKPSLDGASPDCYSSTLGNLDVHYSSGVANHFFYLLAEGAVVPAGFGAGSQFETDAGITLTPASLVCNGNTAITGIGREAASKIWYRALTVYMTSNTNYAGARAATLSAAADLYGAGSTQANAVAAAWSAVKVR